VTRIALIAHAPLASAWAACATHILGISAQIESQFECVDIASDVPIEATVKQLAQRLSPNNPGDGLLVLSDIFGATPFNIARRVVQQLQAQGQAATLLTGTNLCMLLKALTLAAEHADIHVLAEHILQSGHKGIMQATCADNAPAQPC